MYIRLCLKCVVRKLSWDVYNIEVWSCVFTDKIPVSTFYSRLYMWFWHWHRRLNGCIWILPHHFYVEFKIKWCPNKRKIEQSRFGREEFVEKIFGMSNHWLHSALIYKLPTTRNRMDCDGWMYLALVLKLGNEKLALCTVYTFIWFFTQPYFV